LPASLIFGFVWKVFSFKAAFIMGACIAAVALIMLLFLKTGNFKKKSYEIPESKL